MPAGGSSLPGPRLQLFLAGSASGVTVYCFDTDFWVLSIVSTAPFQVPNTSVGGIAAVLPCCQSPPRHVGLPVMSVMKSAGNAGRPEPSRPPCAIDAPTAGLTTWPGLAVSGAIG